MPDRFADAARVLSDGVAARAFPGAVVEVGTATEPIWRRAFGYLTYEPKAQPTTLETVYDLASLTKVISTATLGMQAVETGRLPLEDPVARWIGAWRGADRDHVTVRDLFEHTSGLTAYLPFFRDHRGRVDYERAICTLPLEYRPRSLSVYSDLGFILLGFIIEDASGRRLERLFDPIARAVEPEPLLFNPPRSMRPLVAPTEEDQWRGRLLVGEVHDENAYALGGAAGHAGLFGTAGAVGTFARLVLRGLHGEHTFAAPETFRLFATRSDVAASSRALAWDTALPSSSCGRLMSLSAIGHTGFTGTSLWIDHKRGLYFVLLTNRVHPTREKEALREIRPRLHDALLGELLAV
jgi:CubicO group peptidase (beta-lactamase class C family)